MKVKVVKFNISNRESLENRLNTELLGWKITKIIRLDIERVFCSSSECEDLLDYDRVTLIGEVDAS
jgi:hypothetical protein